MRISDWSSDVCSSDLVTARCDWRIADLVEADHPASLYLVIPPSDISRTKPLIRLILNQIGRRLTEKLDADRTQGRKHQLLMMLDECPALGRLDFCETSLAFMSGFAIGRAHGGTPVTNAHHDGRL